eukprot:g15484.t1
MALLCTSFVLVLFWGVLSAAQTSMLLVGASEMSPVWLLGALAVFAFQCWLLRCFFPDAFRQSSRERRKLTA